MGRFIRDCPNHSIVNALEQEVRAGSEAKFCSQMDVTFFLKITMVWTQRNTFEI